MKAVIIKSRGNIALGKLRAYDTQSNEQADLFYAWPDGLTYSDARMLPDGRIYGLATRSDEASGLSVLQKIYLAAPSSTGPAPISEFRFDGPGQPQLGYVSVRMAFDWGMLLATRGDDLIVVKIDTDGTPVAMRQSFGTFDRSGGYGIISFADHSARLVSVNAQAMTFSVSTEIGSGAINYAATFPLEIPSPPLPPNLSDPNALVAIGAAMCGAIMSSVKPLGDASSMDAWLAVNDPLFGRMTQYFPSAVVGARDKQDMVELAGWNYPYGARFISLSVDPGGLFQINYHDDPGTPLPDPLDPQEQFTIFQALPSPQREEAPFWHNFLRCFETIE